MHVDQNRPLGIAHTFARYCEGEDQELLIAQKALHDYHNSIWREGSKLGWVKLAELERDVVKAALNAGYRMALRDAKAALNKI